jgi:hypothetical protein
MKLALRLLMLAGLLALGYWGWRAAFPDPRKVVLHRLEKLAQIASFPPDEGPVAKLANVQKLAGYFADQVTVNVEVQGVEKAEFSNREDLIQAMQAGRSAASSEKAKFLGPKIEMTPGNQEAIVGVALAADINGEQNAVVVDLKIEMKKIGGDWLITLVESVQ